MTLPRPRIAFYLRSGAALHYTLFKEVTMTKFNQALIAGASSIALFAGALTLITPAANAATRCTHNDFLGTSTWS